jgi:hypothetical protein
MDFTIYQMISFLNKIENKDRKFKRKNDDKFIVFRGNYNDLMIQVGDIIRIFPIFNYTQDKWILVENEEN